jgi:phage gp36-like protein
MAYATTADLEERLGPALYVQLTDDGGSGMADESKAAEALAAGEGEVNSHLARRHAVPVNVALHPMAAAVLKGVTLDLAAFRLHARRPPVPEDVRYKREAALRWLERVASGEAMLPSAEEIAGNPARGFSAVTAGPVRVLTREEMEDL